MDISVHASLHLSCHHQILYAKSKLKLNTPPSPPPRLYERIVGDYKNTQLLNRTIETFNWEKLLGNKNVNEQLYLFKQPNQNTD